MGVQRLSCLLFCEGSPSLVGFCSLCANNRAKPSSPAHATANADSWTQCCQTVLKLSVCPQLHGIISFNFQPFELLLLELIDKPRKMWLFPFNAWKTRNNRTLTAKSKKKELILSLEKLFFKFSTQLLRHLNRDLKTIKPQEHAFSMSRQLTPVKELRT